MKLNLENKIVLVTGSTRGIGLAIAKAFREEGAIVVLNSRSQTWICSEDVLKDSMHIAGDVTDSRVCFDIVEKITLKYGKLDILVSNVGSGNSVLPGTESQSEWEKILKLNLLSQTTIIEKSLEQLKKTQGNIVCISSICGIDILDGAPLIYSAAKAALNSYVKGLSKVIGRDGVRINAIAPGNINFEGSIWQRLSKDRPQVVEKMLIEDVALKRFGLPHEIADMAVFLASSKSSFTTGSIVVIDGGHTK